MSTIQDRPNILFITCHDLGRHLGCYGRSAPSPEIDRLSHEGVTFDNYFVCSPQCSPSRAAITTGRYPHRTGVMGITSIGDWKMDSHAPTLAKVFGAGGYDTWLWGFQHEHEEPAELGYRHDPIAFRRGEVPKILANYVTPRLCDWLTSKPQGPWLASVGFFETHLPWKAGPATLEQLRALRPPEYLPDDPALRKDMTELNATLHDLDSGIGRILDTLESSGLAENTIVIFTTDHGLPLPRAKCDLYDPGVEAAFIMRWPGRLQPNRRCGELLSAVDVLPTLLDLAGLAHPDGMDGRSFAGLLTGGAYQPRDMIFTEQTWHDIYRPVRAVRTHRHKLIQRFTDVPAKLLPKDFYTCCAAGRVMREHFDYIQPRLEFYDLATDPLEQHNLHNTVCLPKQEFERLQAILQDWMAQTGDPLLHGPVHCPNGAAPTPPGQ